MCQPKTNYKFPKEIKLLVKIKKAGSFFSKCIFTIFTIHTQFFFRINMLSINLDNRPTGLQNK